MITRRQALLGAGAVLLGGAVPLFAKQDQTKKTDEQELAKWMDYRKRLDGSGGWPWKPQKISPDMAAKLGYSGFYNSGQGCGYGVFKGLVGQMALKYGKPYDGFPLQMMAYGASGVGNWGTLCGSLNGAAAAFGLFYDRNASTELIDALFHWYETAKIPAFEPSIKKLDFTPQATVPHSTLCHVSVSKWCYETGIEMHSPERSERCARVTADVAKKAAELLNARIAGKPIQSKPSKNQATCMACHDKGKDSDIAKGKMDCGTCHDGHLDSKFSDHP